MEYKLNKIDTDIRKKMREECKTDKVHANDKINIKKDLKQDDKNNINENSDKNKNNRRRFITIDGIKTVADRINVEVERLDTLSIDNSSGRILDTKK